MDMSEVERTGCSCFETVLREQKQRIVAALVEVETLDASPIILDDEYLNFEEHITLVYELHHVHLPELESQGLVEFARQNDQVTRGPRFDGPHFFPKHGDVTLN